MMRRLPVLQTAALERRAFLLGLVATTVAACSSSEDNVLGGKKTSNSSSSSSSGSTGSSGGSTGTDAGDDEDLDASIPTKDSSTGSSGGMDSSTGPTGCAAAGVDVGAAGTFGMGTLTFVQSQLVYIGRDAGGLYAMYGLCTHAIGNMRVDANGLTCLVHGAQFSLTGAVTKGPATAALPHYALCLNSKGNVAVDTKTVVPATTRLVA